MAVLEAEHPGDGSDGLVGIGEIEIGQVDLCLQDLLLHGHARMAAEQGGDILLIIAEVGGDVRDP